MNSHDFWKYLFYLIEAHVLISLFYAIRTTKNLIATNFKVDGLEGELEKKAGQGSFDKFKSVYARNPSFCTLIIVASFLFVSLIHFPYLNFSKNKEGKK